MVHAMWKTELTQVALGTGHLDTIKVDKGRFFYGCHIIILFPGIAVLIT
jgi:hypothetical protein